MARTYYEVLGVDESASTAEIEAAYRERLKETHPDVTDDPDATDTVQEVIDARDVLTDEAERARYDRVGHEAYVAGDLTGAATASTSSSTTGTTATQSSRASRSQSTSDPSSVGRDGQARNGTGENPWTEPPNQAGTERAWSSGSGDAPAHPSDPNAVRWSRLFPPGQSVVLLLASFICYPSFLLFSIYPPFPIAINFVVLVCTLVLVGYLISLPEVGILVFGFWGVVTAGAILTGALGVITLPGVLAITATWLPLGLSIVVFRLVR